MLCGVARFRSETGWQPETGCLAGAGQGGRSDSDLFVQGRHSQQLAQALVALFGRGCVQSAIGVLCELQQVPAGRWLGSQLSVHLACSNCRSRHVALLRQRGGWSCPLCCGDLAQLRADNANVYVNGRAHLIYHIERAISVLRSLLQAGVAPPSSAPISQGELPDRLLGQSAARKGYVTSEAVESWIRCFEPAGLAADLAEHDLEQDQRPAKRARGPPPDLVSRAMDACHGGAYLKLHPVPSEPDNNACSRFVYQARFERGEAEPTGLAAALLSNTLYETALLLVCLSGWAVTQLHADPAWAVNVGYAVLDGPVHVDPDSLVLAVWLFVDRERLEAGVALLRSVVRSELGEDLTEGAEISWTAEVLEEAARRAQEQASADGGEPLLSLLYQLPRKPVFVEPGAAHVVVTVQASVKIAWDYFEPRRLGDLARAATARAQRGVAGEDFMFACDSVLTSVY